jgi:hypothetical protein
MNWNGTTNVWPGTEGSGTVLYNELTNLNTQISNQVATFGAAGQNIQYFDIREYLVQQANLVQFPTPQETNNLLYDMPAAQLCTWNEPPHLNGDGYGTVATNVAAILGYGFPNGNYVTVEQMMSLMCSNQYSFNPQQTKAPLVFASLNFGTTLDMVVAQDEFEFNFSGNLLSANGGNLGDPTQGLWGQVNAQEISAETNMTVGASMGNGSNTFVLNGVTYTAVAQIGVEYFTGLQTGVTHWRSTNEFWYYTNWTTLSNASYFFAAASNLNTQFPNSTAVWFDIEHVHGDCPTNSSAYYQRAAASYYFSNYQGNGTYVASGRVGPNDGSGANVAYAAGTGYFGLYATGAGSYALPTNMVWDALVHCIIK